MHGCSLSSRTLDVELFGNQLNLSLKIERYSSLIFGKNLLVIYSFKRL